MKKNIVIAYIVHPYYGFAQLTTVFKNKIDSIHDSNKDAIGLIIHVEAPKPNISWSYAEGISNIKTTEPLNYQQPVLIASNTKHYVSTAILRL